MKDKSLNKLILHLKGKNEAFEEILTWCILANQTENALYEYIFSRNESIKEAIDNLESENEE